MTAYVYNLPPWNIYIYNKKNISQSFKYTIDVALIRPRIMSTLTALPVGQNKTLYIYSISFFGNHHYFTILWFCIYLQMSFVFRALMEAARDWVVFIQIAKCSDPRARTMGHTWFVWNALSCVYFSITECFGVAARRPDEIKHLNSIEVISLECLRTKTQLKRSAGAW